MNLDCAKRAHARPEFRARVEFAGRRDQAGVLDYLRRAEICCLPSHMETFGIAAVEALKVGKPVIYSRTGPGPEVVNDGVSGLLCDPTSAGDVAAKIELLLEKSDFSAQVGRNARARVLEKFNKADWIPRNVAFFESSIAQSRTGKATR